MEVYQYTFFSSHSSLLLSHSYFLSSHSLDFRNFHGFPQRRISEVYKQTVYQFQYNQYSTSENNNQTPSINTLACSDIANEEARERSINIIIRSSQQTTIIQAKRYETIQNILSKTNYSKAVESGAAYAQLSNKILKMNDRISNNCTIWINGKLLGGRRNKLNRRKMGKC
jgi:hypothetical protein